MVAMTQAGTATQKTNAGLEHRYRALLEGPEPTSEAG